MGASLKLWMAALKPPIYNTIIVPVLVGTAAAKADGHSVSLQLCWQMMLAMILLLTWCNISNDVFDAMTGVDEEKEESYVSVSGSWWGCLIVSKICLVLSFVMVRSSVQHLSDPRILYRILTSAGIAYLYQGPPFRLSYKGVGELLCFLAFGIVGTPAFYFMQAPRSQPSSLLNVCSVLVGCTTSCILFCSHFHQGEKDKLAGKLSPIVRLGTKRASELLTLLVVGVYLTVLLCFAEKIVPFKSVALIGVSVPLAKQLVDTALKFHDRKEDIRHLKISASRWHIVFHVMLSVSLIL
eukprot:Plantae.Rhodophyta-Purpureofilum_apyrenoidigerum.ctg22859.p2 GENE.Plantae.Rhodophyta-Purpureofilum_apyrenoidigerum.ctg22859~~Plantae.Rhodophyta-Purpureofilum_apyrenoidigerum.ctg22859.p2  ORF type:complete len:296 (-),score=42.00 Plantae.Rhodophyta-Purpureofilum_apyrenoidigerum.ctg22859:1176-2063(-)